MFDGTFVVKIRHPRMLLCQYIESTGALNVSVWPDDHRLCGSAPHPSATQVCTHGKYERHSHLLNGNLTDIFTCGARVYHTRSRFSVWLQDWMSDQHMYLLLRVRESYHGFQNVHGSVHALHASTRDCMTEPIRYLSCVNTFISFLTKLLAGHAKGPGFQYPGAFVDTDTQTMFVSYSIGKEDIGLTKFPLTSLQ